MHLRRDDNAYGYKDKHIIPLIMTNNCLIKRLYTNARTHQFRYAVKENNNKQDERDRGMGETEDGEREREMSVGGACGLAP